MFIVARDPDRFATTYEEIVLKLVKEKGFDTVISKPIASYQGSNCIYRDEGAEVPEEPRSPLPVQPSPVRPSPVKPEARWAIPLYPSPVSPSKPNHTKPVEPTKPSKPANPKFNLRRMFQWN